MVVETHTEISVEQSAGAAPAEEHQEAAPAVVSEETVQNVIVVDLHQVTQKEQTEEKEDPKTEKQSNGPAEVVDMTVESKAEQSNDNVSGESEKPKETQMASEERSVVTEQELVSNEPKQSLEQNVQQTRGISPQEEGSLINHVDEAAATQNDPEEPLELPKFIHAAMEKVGKERGFTVGLFKIEFDVGSNKGDGFVGQMFKAYLTEGDRREAYLCKIPPLNEARRQQFPVMTVFTRETLVYTKFLPVIFAYQEEKGVSRKDGFFNAPKCYYAECNEATEESVIIMEDLRLNGYRMWNKMVPVNYEHARLTMEQLGRLHAVSLALKRDRPEDFEQFKVPDTMTAIMTEGSPFESMMKQMMADAMETLESHETKEHAKLQKLLDNVRLELINCSKSDLAEPYAVLGHGDCWINNFMYHYEKGAPDKIVLLDWQITRYVSPVLDLVYFLFCCTDEEFRRRHYDEMMNIYYNSLAALLEKLGHSPQDVFPRTALIRQLRRFGRFGILMAVFLVPMLCTRNEDLPDMDETAEKFRETKDMDMNPFTLNTNKNVYRKRISAVVRDTIRYGYL